jgi:thioredoxin reductase (NADPH)
VALFIFIGAKPMTERLQIDIIKDGRRFLKVSEVLARYANFRKNWKLKRDPLLFETYVLKFFTTGDLQPSSMNLVAFAVGEGSMAIKCFYGYL